MCALKRNCTQGFWTCGGGGVEEGGVEKRGGGVWGGTVLYTHAWSCTWFRPLLLYFHVINHSLTPDF